MLIFDTAGAPRACHQAKGFANRRTRSALAARRWLGKAPAKTFLALRSRRKARRRDPESLQRTRERSRGINDWVINEGVLRDKVRTVIQKRSDSEWRSRHVKRLNRKPSVVFGNVNRIICDHKGNFTIPKEAPPTMATNYWQETVYEYHDDGFEQWSVPVGTIEHERVKRLTQRYNYEDLREEAERYLAEMESERLAQPPEVSDSDVDAEIDKGVLLINRLSSSKNRR